MQLLVAESPAEVPAPHESVGYTKHDYVRLEKLFHFWGKVCKLGKMKKICVRDREVV